MVSSGLGFVCFYTRQSNTKGFPCGSAGKESACNEGDVGSISGLGRSSGEGKGYPLQYSDLENSMDCIVHGVAKSQTQLSNFHFGTRSNISGLRGWFFGVFFFLKCSLKC